jgi:hypothetical protein
MDILDTPLVNITYDKQDGLLSFNWRKYVPSDSLREIYVKSIKMIPRNPSKWFLDKKHIKIIAPEDQKWLASYWTDQQMQQQIKIAFLDSVDLFGQISIKNVVKALNSNNTKVSAKIFEKQEQALEWLKS